MNSARKRTLVVAKFFAMTSADCEGDDDDDGGLDGELVFKLCW